MNSLNITVDHFNDLLNNYKSLRISEFNPNNVIFPSNLPSPILPISYRLKCAIVRSGNTRFINSMFKFYENFKAILKKQFKLKYVAKFPLFIY